jgi:transketolase
MGQSLVEIGQTDGKVIVLDADVAHPTRSCLFEESFPDRFIQAGLTEQNMVGVAAGLASCGFIPIVVCFASFLARRCFDQIYNSVSYPNLNVKLVGAYCGFSTPGTGASHQTFDDIAIMSTLPNITIINVGDPIEVNQAMREMVSIDGPVYLRIARIDESESFYTEDDRFRIGEVMKVSDGQDGLLMSTGIMTNICIRAGDRLRKEGVSMSLYHLPTLKPINASAVKEILSTFRTVFTVEDHGVFGGLGTVINNIAVAMNSKATITNIGIEDRFGKCGRLEDLFTYFRLSDIDICERVKSALK